MKLIYCGKAKKGKEKFEAHIDNYLTKYYNKIVKTLTMIGLNAETVLLMELLKWTECCETKTVASNNMVEIYTTVLFF